MAEQFKITVERFRDTMRKGGKEWRVVGHEGNTPQGAPKYGYTPEIDVETRVAEIIYEQTVDGLNLASLIATVNNLDD